MLKLLLFGIGFILVFEGILYFLLANNFINIFKMIKKFSPYTIRSFSAFLIIIGFCFIYLSLKIYNVGTI